MALDLDRVRANVRDASTEDLLDRATVYSAGMEPEALTIIDEELCRRGVRAAEVAEHDARRRRALLPGPDGLPLKCWKCSRPAVMTCWTWHRMWGRVPLFPRRAAYCEEHRPL
jgi:hypothetical protein